MKRETAIGVVRARLDGLQPRFAIVLGSGLGGLPGAIEDPRVIPYEDIPGFPQTSVAGHAGKLIGGTLEDVPVILQCGRFHLYEGHEPATVALPVRLFAELGVETLVLTNAAGGLNPRFLPPTLMLIADHMNLQWRNPLLGLVADHEERFPDMSDPYDAGLRSLVRAVSLEQGIPLEEGVYAAVLGPSYETPAEIEMLRRLGADAVGMSTVPEVLVARARGLRVLGISSITNWGAGIGSEPLSHEEVLAAAGALARQLEPLLRGVVRRAVGQ